MLVLDAFIQPLPHTRLVVVTTCYATQVPMTLSTKSGRLRTDYVKVIN